MPATVVALEEGNVVTAIKSAETDGYAAVQVGYKVVKERKITKPELGHLAKAGCKPMKHLREFKVRGGGRGDMGRGGSPRLHGAACRRRAGAAGSQPPPACPGATTSSWHGCPAFCAVLAGSRARGAASSGQGCSAPVRGGCGSAARCRLGWASHPTTPASSSPLPQLKDAAKVAEFQPGQELDVPAMFEAGTKVDVAGTSIGKGFQGGCAAARLVGSGSQARGQCPPRAAPLHVDVTGCIRLHH